MGTQNGSNDTDLDNIAQPSLEKWNDKHLPLVQNGAVNSPETHLQPYFFPLNHSTRTNERSYDSLVARFEYLCGHKLLFYSSTSCCCLLAPTGRNRRRFAKKIRALALFWMEVSEEKCEKTKVIFEKGIFFKIIKCVQLSTYFMKNLPHYNSNSNPIFKSKI